MATYGYIARDQDGQAVEGRLSGHSLEAVLSELQARHLAPVRVRPLRDEPMFQRRISVNQLATTYRQLSDLIRAGVPLLRSLSILSQRRAHPRLATVMGKVRDAVAQGSRLADAMGSYPSVFPDVQVAMVRAGEHGGFLDQVLSRLAAFLERQAELRARLIGSLIYPLLLLVVGVGVVVAALISFVPQFRDLYTDIELPVPTQILLGTSDFLVNYWGVVLLMLLALSGGIAWSLRLPSVQEWLSVVQLKVPLWGKLVRSSGTARFCRMLGTLLDNSIPVLSALKISRDAVGNPVLTTAVEEAQESVQDGGSLTSPLAASGFFEEDVIEMIAVGESANNLSCVLLTAAETIERRIDRQMALMIRLTEPLLLLCMAGVVLFIFIALVVPMMKMNSAL